MWYAYIGNFLIVALIEAGAAYSITKIVHAYVSLAKSDHLTQNGHSQFGNWLHMIELFNTVVFIFISADLGVGGILAANMLYRNF